MTTSAQAPSRRVEWMVQEIIKGMALLHWKNGAAIPHPISLPYGGGASWQFISGALESFSESEFKDTCDSLIQLGWNAELHKSESGRYSLRVGYSRFTNPDPEEREQSENKQINEEVRSELESQNLNQAAQELNAKNYTNIGAHMALIVAVINKFYGRK